MSKAKTQTASDSWIILLDTSVILNVLDVPGRNAQRAGVFQQLEAEIHAGSSLFLPFATIIEVGSHISRIPDGNLRRKYAQRFVDQLEQAFKGEAPWTPMRIPEREQLRQWVQDFPASAVAEKSLTDHTIIKEWEDQCEKFPQRNVKIWSLDRKDLQGYERKGG